MGHGRVAAYDGQYLMNSKREFHEREVSETYGGWILRSLQNIWDDLGQEII